MFFFAACTLIRCCRYAAIFSRFDAAAAADFASLFRQRRHVFAFLLSMLMLPPLLSISMMLSRLLY